MDELNKPDNRNAKCIQVVPLVSSIQKIGIYETKARFFVIGSNQQQSRFRVLKLDRTESQQLLVTDDGLVYSAAEIRDIMRSLDEGNRLRSAGSAAQGLVRRVSAFGIVGFVRFTEGYYMITITQRRRVAVIGPHVIYKIEDTKMVYIPHQTRKSSAEEQRYLRLFQSIAMGSNFYFSYSYDLTHTLQYNAALPRLTTEDVTAAFGDAFLGDRPAGEGPVEAASEFSVSFASPADLAPGASASVPTVGVSAEPHRRFVWNNHLLAPAEAQLSWEWRLYVTHGFIGQTTLYLHGRNLFLTLIARRSSQYAGTRFLKRGASFVGDVANEVETEQIVHDACVSSLQRGAFSSHVQIRGSVPCHWYQDTSRIPKPPIQMELSDPCHLTPGKHMNNLLLRYGAPVVVVNLVKKGEKRSHESLLHAAFSGAVAYLNQFLPPPLQLRYISFDMARANKLKRESVMERLTEIANSALKETGIFLSQPPLNKDARSPRQEASPAGAQRQRGVVRVNCVDCLDRTNTAQFAIGKSALALQLYSLGAIASPELEFDTDCMSILEDLYEDHGDVLALQYGGSQLVHRIRTYRKTQHWGHQGNDIMQTMQRYYSNTFSDSDKQNAINLFLGCYVPDPGRPPLWELPSDYQLHHRPSDRDIYTCSPTQWWSDAVMRALPFAALEAEKRCQHVLLVSGSDERADSYREQYRPGELSSFSELYVFNMTHSVRDYMPALFVDESPFAVRTRRRPLPATESNGKQSQQTTPAGAETSGSEASDSSDDTLLTPSVGSVPSGPTPEKGAPLTMANLLTSPQQQYGIQLRQPSKLDLTLYKRQALLGQAAPWPSSLPPREALKAAAAQPEASLHFSQLKMDSSREVAPPVASREAKETYQRAVSCRPEAISKHDMSIYRRFVLNSG